MLWKNDFLFRSRPQVMFFIVCVGFLCSSQHGNCKVIMLGEEGSKKVGLSEEILHRLACMDDQSWKERWGSMLAKPLWHWLRHISSTVRELCLVVSRSLVGVLLLRSGLQTAAAAPAAHTFIITTYTFTKNCKNTNHLFWLSQNAVMTHEMLVKFGVFLVFKWNNFGFQHLKELASSWDCI